MEKPQEENIRPSEPRYKAQLDGKPFVVPCGKCVYLIDQQVCPFVRCVKCEGWRVTNDVEGIRQRL